MPVAWSAFHGLGELCLAADPQIRIAQKDPVSRGRGNRAIDSEHGDRIGLARLGVLGFSLVRCVEAGDDRAAVLSDLARQLAVNSNLAVLVDRGHEWDGLAFGRFGKDDLDPITSKSRPDRWRTGP